MSISAPESPRALRVEILQGYLVVHLEDGRTVSVPLEWFPKLRDASPDALGDWRLVGRGVGIHWPKLDEDLSVRGLLGPEHVPQRRQKESKSEQKDVGFGTWKHKRIESRRFVEKLRNEWSHR